MPTTYEDITPCTDALLGFANEKWSIKGALAELIDNSFGPARGDANTVEINYNRKTRWLTVCDNGRGMDHLSKLFQFGAGQGSQVKDIGKYGMGGTRALLWLAGAKGKVTVSTLHEGLSSETTVDYGAVQRSGKWEIKVTGPRQPRLGNTPALLLEHGHGTHIGLKVRNTTIWSTDAIKSELARLYGAGLRSDKRILYSENDSTPVSLAPPNLRSTMEPIVIECGDLTATGAIWYEPTAKESESYVAINYGPREIKRARECYGEYSGVGVGGWIDLGEGWQHALTTTKNAFHDQTLYNALMDVLYKKLKPFLEALQEERDQIALEALGVSVCDTLEGAFDIKIGNKTPRPSGTAEGDGTDRDGNGTDRPAPDIDETATTAHGRALLQLDWLNNEQIDGRVSIVENFLHEGRFCVRVTLNQDLPQVALSRRARTPESEMILQLAIVPVVIQHLLELPIPRQREMFGPDVLREIAGKDPVHAQQWLTAHVLMKSAASARKLVTTAN